MHRLASLALTTALSGVLALTVTDAARTGDAQIKLGVSGFANANPSIASHGRTVVIAWAASRNGVTDVYAATSRDAGATFSAYRRVNNLDGDANFNGDQGTRVTVGGTDESPVITVVWPVKKAAIRMARSLDGGKSFASAITIHGPDLHGVRGWQSAAVAADSTLHALWLDGRNAGGAPDATKMASGQPRQDVFHASVMPNGHIVETRVATDVCFCCKTAVAVGSGGRVYAAWRHIFPESIRDMAFSMSRDGGASFTPVVRVSQDNWKINGCPEDGPAMVVDAGDVIHLVWPTLVNDGQPEKALFYGFSRDGSVFSERRRVPAQGSTTPSHPQLALGVRGELAVVWDDVSNGLRRVSMSRSPRPATDDGRRFSPPEVVSGEDPARFPAVARLGDGFVIVWTSGTPETSVIAVRRVF